MVITDNVASAIVATGQPLTASYSDPTGGKISLPSNCTISITRHVKHLAILTMVWPRINGILDGIPAKSQKQKSPLNHGLI